MKSEKIQKFFELNKNQQIKGNELDKKASISPEKKRASFFVKKYSKLLTLKEEDFGESDDSKQSISEDSEDKFSYMTNEQGSKEKSKESSNKLSPIQESPNILFKRSESLTKRGRNKIFMRNKEFVSKTS